MKKIKSIIISFTLVLAIALIAPMSTFASASDTCPVHGDNCTEHDGTCPDFDNIIVGVEELDGLDIFTITRSTDSTEMMFNLIYDRLLEMDSEGNLQSGLAESWQYLNDDMTTLEMNLREWVEFHDGVPFDAQAVDSLIQFAQAQPTDSLIYQQWTPIQSVSVVSDYTIVFNLNQRDNYFLQSLAYPMASIANVIAYDDGITTPIGTGAFRYDELIMDNSLELSRFDDYWGNTAPIETVTLKLVTEDMVIEMLDFSDINLASIRDYEELTNLDNDSNLQTNIYATKDILSLTFNLTGTHQAIQDVRVRRAISHALDNQAIINLAYRGYGYALPNPNYSSTIQALLNDAGYEDGFSITLATTSSQASKKAAQKVKEFLEDINITVNVQTLDRKALDQAAKNGSFDMLISELDMSRPSALYDLYHTNGYNNISGYSNADVDMLLENERTISDPEIRLQALLDIYDILNFDVTVVGMGIADLVVGIGVPTGNTTCGYNWGPIYEWFYRWRIMLL